MTSILRRMRLSKALTFFALVTATSMIIFCIYFFRAEKTRIQRQPVPIITNLVIQEAPFIKNIKYKIINLHSFPSYYELKTGSMHFQDCPINTCSYSEDAKSMEESDAVIFFAINQTPVPPPPKLTGQIWIYFNVESPIHSNSEFYGGDKWDSLFNWTMTYRLDSDIKFGYGVVMNLTGSRVKKDYMAIAKRKKKMVAWFVSNCQTQSQRMKFVKMLQKFIPVDIYGRCSQLKCENKQDCLKMLDNDYKFYLSFENSICQDYVTEKMLNILKLVDIIPIVRGGSNYSAILPTKMVINTADYASINDLANYLKYLHSNEEEYASYLKWKDHYTIQEPQDFPHCTLCQRIHNPEKFANSYKNVNHWWTKDRCHEPKDLNNFLV